mgnify:CR=1 FL=1
MRTEVGSLGEIVWILSEDMSALGVVHAWHRAGLPRMVEIVLGVRVRDGLDPECVCFVRLFILAARDFHECD